jgi:hypothetical protein
LSVVAVCATRVLRESASGDRDDPVSAGCRAGISIFFGGGGEEVVRGMRHGGGEPGNGKKRSVVIVFP